jgi:hypothetical protein
MKLQVQHSPHPKKQARIFYHERSKNRLMLVTRGIKTN